MQAKSAQVAIIIDDIGYRHTDHSALELPGNITYSILPHTPYGKRLALKAQQQNNEVLLHIPMEAQNGKKLGPGALTSDMSESNIRESLRLSFEEIPFAIGINNHMGSRLTQLYSPMVWTMRFLKERNMLFLDSLTTDHSKAEKIAQQLGVPTSHRHIFLDNQLDERYITQQFLQLIRQAKKNQRAIAIGHPHPETMKALHQLLPLLEEENIELVAISTLLAPKSTYLPPIVVTD
ncbi:divergent polysaccharide deacetylase family protein [Colwelliaceae bacterium 6471]